MSRRPLINRRTHTLRVLHPLTGEIVHTFSLYPDAWSRWDNLVSNGSKIRRASAVQLCPIRGTSDVAVLFVRSPRYAQVGFDPDLCSLVILRVAPNGHVRWERHYRAGEIHLDGLTDTPSYRTTGGSAYDHTGLAPLESGDIAVLSPSNSVIALDGDTGATLWTVANPYSAFSVLPIPGTDTVRTSRAWIDVSASGIDGDFGHGEPKGAVRLEYTPPQIGSPGWLFSYYGSSHTKLCVALSGRVICSEQRPPVEYQTYWEVPPGPANTVTGYFVARSGITLRQPSVAGWDWALSQSPDDDDGIVSQHMPAADNFTPFYNDFHASWFGIFGTYDPGDPPFVAKSATICGDRLYVFCDPSFGSDHVRCYDFTGEAIGAVLWEFPCVGGNELAADATGCYVLGRPSTGHDNGSVFKLSPAGDLLWTQQYRSLEQTSDYMTGNARSLCLSGDFLYVAGDEEET